MNAETTWNSDTPRDVPGNAAQVPAERFGKETEEMVEWLHGFVASQVWFQMYVWLQQHCPAHLAGKESASDIIQSAYRRAHANVDQCVAESDEARIAWFRAIVRNKLQETIKRYSAGKRDVGKERPNVEVDGEAAPTLALHKAQRQQWPDAEVIRDEIRGVVKKVVSSLPEDQMRVIHLQYYENLSRAEIAQRLGISPGAAANRTRAAWRTLRHALSQHSDMVT